MKKLYTFLLSLFLSLVNISFSQWSSDPNTNLTICDVTGEQALAKIAITSDGGCYISWFDTRLGAYNVYLQRLDPLGYKQWAADGLLISNNPQDTWITDYDLICDQNDNAVLVFSDIRVTGFLKPFAYKISPNREFLWGANGIDISSGDSFQPSPTLTETSDGNIVFAWISSDGSEKIALQKLSPTGQKLWGTDPILIQSATENYSYPAVVKSDNDQVILIHTVQTGGFPPQTRIRAQKLDANGGLVWGANGVMIQDNGQMAFFQVPKVESDGNNGALIAWYDGRAGDNLSSSFIQRISSGGTIYFPANGSEGSLAVQRNKFYPQVVIDQSSQETYMFWIETEPNQNQNGIYGQKFSASGNRLWGNSGKEFIRLSVPFTKSLSNLSSHIGNNQIYIFYLDSEGSGLNSKTTGFACDTSGVFIWPGNFVTLSNATQEKLEMETAMDVYKNCKLVWGDKRLDASGIYAQDINSFGQLGQPIIPVELISFTAKQNGGNITLQWKTATETNNQGFEIQKRVGSKQLAVDKWETIGFVTGFGTTTEPRSYSFIDALTHNLSHTLSLSYRLKQIDFDGTNKYSYEVSIEVTLPLEYSIKPNFPNPFNPSTKIKYSIAEESFVSLKIFNLIGQEIATLVNQHQKIGTYKVNFNAEGLNSGIYIAKLTTNGFSQSIKLTLLK